MNRTTLAICAVLLISAGPAIGQTYSWNNSAGGNWNIGTNWSGGTVPGAGQNALIDQAGTYTVLLTDNESIAAVTVNQANATLEQTGGDLTASGLFSLQAGTLHLTGGRILANGGLTTATGTIINMDGGQLWATPAAGGTAVINSQVNWSAGVIDGPTTASIPFSLNGSVNLIGTGTRTLSRTGVVDLNAGGTWDAGRLNLGSSTTLHLAAGQTITNTAASGTFILATPNGEVGPIFNIDGTFIKQGTNDTQFWSPVVVNNNGKIDVQSGTLNMMGSGTHTGIFQVDSGATLQFRGGQTLNSGQLNVADGATLLIGNVSSTTTVASGVTVSIAPTANVQLNYGSLDLPSNANLSPQTLGVSNGLLTIRGTTSPQNLTLDTGGEIRSESNSSVSVRGGMTWTGGQISWVNSFTVAGSTDLPGTGSRQLTSDTFNNRSSTMTLNGGGTWDAGEIKLNTKAGIVIAAGTTITNTTASGNFAINPPDATAQGGYVTLNGTFIKEGTNTTTFGRSITILNSGLMDIRTGTVAFSTDVYNAAGGDYTLAAGTTLQGTSITINGSTFNKGLLQGEGTVASSLVLNAGGRIRAGSGGPGVLTVGTGSLSTNSFFINGDATDPPRIVVAADRTGSGTANAGRIALTGQTAQSIVNFNVGNGKIIQFEIAGTGLQLGEKYTVAVVTAAGGFERNTGFPHLSAGYVFDPGDYQLIGNYPGFQDVSLFLSDANTLSLQFTPVPEPTAILGIAAGTLGLGSLIRQRISKQKSDMSER